MKEDLLKQKEKQLTVLKNKHRTSLTEVLGSMPEKDFAMTLKKLESGLNSEVNALKKNLNGKKTQVSNITQCYFFDYVVEIVKHSGNIIGFRSLKTNISG